MTRKTAVKPAPVHKTTGESQFEIRLGWAMLGYFLLSLLYFLPAFLPGNHIYGTDYTQAGYMMYEFTRERIHSGTLPKWMPYIMGGLPMFANPGSTFYPLRLLADLVMPGSRILPTLLVFQFTMAGTGMYLLTRELGCRRWVAFIAGLAFQFTGLTMSYVHAGHDGRIIVATFAPLFLYFLHRGIRTGGIGPFVGAATTLGFTLLSFQIQTNYYLLIAGAAWAVFALVHFGLVRKPRALTMRVALGLAAVVFGFAMAAVNFLPFNEYVADSPRGATRGYDYSITWSMPPVEALGVAVPEQIGLLDDYHGKNPFKLHTEYVGALVCVLFVLGFALMRRSREWWFFLGLTVFMLSIAFGGYTPLYRFYYAVLPGTTKFRAPSVSFFLVSLSMVVMAALTLERIATVRLWQQGRPRPPADDRAAKRIGWLLPVAAALTLFALILTAAIAGSGSPTTAGMGRFTAFAILTLLALWLWWLRALPTVLCIVLLSLSMLSDLYIIDHKFFSTVEAPETMFAPDPLITTLVQAPRPNRVWILPQEGGTESNVLALFDVEQAGGEHGNQLQRWNEYVGTGEKVYVDWHNLVEKSNFVNAANVQYIISRIDLKPAGKDTAVLREIHNGGGWVYQNLRALPRAYLIPEIVSTADTMAALTMLRDSTFDIRRRAVVYSQQPIPMDTTPLQGSARVVEHTPDKVVVETEASRPALLVLADNWHKDWQVHVNGKRQPILRANHTFRGVMVGSGKSELVFEFKPQALYTGFYIYLATLAMLLGYVVWLLARKLRHIQIPD